VKLVDVLRDERGFIHRRLIAGVAGLISGGPGVGVTSFFRGGGPRGQKSPPSLAARGQLTPSGTLSPGTLARMGLDPTTSRNTLVRMGLVPAECPPGFVDTGRGCVLAAGTPTPGVRGAIERALPFGRTGFGGNGGGNGRQKVPGLEGQIERLLPFGESGFFGEVVPGRYGAAVTPDVNVEVQVLDCPGNLVLGDDDLCYKKRDLRKDQRKWPPARKPLLTGGDLNAIAKANRAATKLQDKQKQLQDMGMLKKPTRSKPRVVPTGHHAHVAHD